MCASLCAPQLLEREKQQIRRKVASNLLSVSFRPKETVGGSNPSRGTSVKCWSEPLFSRKTVDFEFRLPTIERASICDSGLLTTVCPHLKNFWRRKRIWNVTFGARICH